MSIERITETKGYLLDESTAFEYILLGDLRDLLEAPVDEFTSSWLAAILDSLLKALPREFQIQNEGGYFAEVLEEQPNLTIRVEHLIQERDILFAKLHHLRIRVSDQAVFETIADQVRLDLRDWMTSLKAFKRHERRLAQTAFNHDIGVGD